MLFRVGGGRGGWRNRGLSSPGDSIGLPVPVAGPLARPFRNKRRLDTDTQAEQRSQLTRRRVEMITIHKAQHLYRHKDITQSLQDIDSTTVQATLHGGGDGNYTD
jgi:hypothetical protein